MNAETTPTLPISVVIPALNAELFLGEAIESVKAQTVRAAEIIVVDNGSVDRTLEVATKHAVKVLQRTDRSGPGAARNKGIESSNQEWIALLDSDDRWHPQKLEEQWLGLKLFPKAAMISCFVLVFENSKILSDIAGMEMRENWKGYAGDSQVADNCRYFSQVQNGFFARFQPSPSDVLIRREVFASVGLFDEEIEYCEDLEMFLRILGRYPLVIVEKALVQNRRHAQKMSFQFEQMRTFLFKVINKMLANPAKYPPGAGEFYRDNLKKNFLLVEKRLSERTRSS